MVYKARRLEQTTRPSRSMETYTSSRICSMLCAPSTAFMTAVYATGSILSWSVV